MADQPRDAGLASTEWSATADLGAMTPLETVMAFVSAAAAIPPVIESQAAAIASAITAVRDRLAGGGRLILVGAGTSGRLATMEAAEVGPTFGIREGIVVAIVAEVDADTGDEAEDDERAGAAAVADLRVLATDALVGIAASGRTPFTLAAMQAAAARDALTIALTCAHPSPMADAAAIAIHPVVGPELLAGSTRLAAGTATKIVLDCLTTGVMAQLGHVYQGRMIDFRAVNTKLYDRATRITLDLSGGGEGEARQALESVGWWPRAAIIRLRLGLDHEGAIAQATAIPLLDDALAALDPRSAHGDG